MSNETYEAAKAQLAKREPFDPPRELRQAQDALRLARARSIVMQAIEAEAVRQDGESVLMDLHDGTRSPAERIDGLVQQAAHLVRRIEWIARYAEGETE